MVGSLLNEAILNQYFSINTRIYFLKVLILICVNLQSLLYSKQLPFNMGQKRSENKEYILIFTKNQLQRIISTSSALINALEKCIETKQAISYDRLGSHPTENAIGHIRDMCHQNHFEDKVKRVVTREPMKRNKITKIK